MDIRYSTDTNIPHDSLNALTESVGWGTRPTHVWDRILQLSSLVISVWDGDKLIGLGRILEDGAMCMVYDIIVHPNYQGKSIGTKIIKQIKDKISQNDFQSVGLFAWDKNPINKIFYQKFGFKAVNFGMKLDMQK